MYDHDREARMCLGLIRRRSAEDRTGLSFIIIIGSAMTAAHDTRETLKACIMGTRLLERRDYLRVNALRAAKNILNQIATE